MTEATVKAGTKTGELAEYRTEDLGLAEDFPEPRQRRPVGP